MEPIFQVGVKFNPFFVSEFINYNSDIDSMTQLGRQIIKITNSIGVGNSSRFNLLKSYLRRKGAKASPQIIILLVNFKFEV